MNQRAINKIQRCLWNHVQDIVTIGRGQHNNTSLCSLNEKKYGVNRSLHSPIYCKWRRCSVTAKGRQQGQTVTPQTSSAATAPASSAASSVATAPVQMNIYAAVPSEHYIFREEDSTESSCRHMKALNLHLLAPDFTRNLNMTHTWTFWEHCGPFHTLSIRKWHNIRVWLDTTRRPTTTPHACRQRTVFTWRIWVALRSTLSGDTRCSSHTWMWSNFTCITTTGTNNNLRTFWFWYANTSRASSPLKAKPRVRAWHRLRRQINHLASLKCHRRYQYWEFGINCPEANSQERF